MRAYPLTTVRLAKLGATEVANTLRSERRKVDEVENALDQLRGDAERRRHVAWIRRRGARIAEVERELFGK